MCLRINLFVSPRLNTWKQFREYLYIKQWVDLLTPSADCVGHVCISNSGLISFFPQLSMWVVSSILEDGDVEHRAMMNVGFIETAKVRHQPI